ncbi:MAG: hypothetical protein ACK5A3_02680, partial [Planctomyces sp.]
AGITQTVEGFDRPEVPAVNETLVVDYAADPLTIPSGPSTTFTFTMDGQLGELTEASGNLSGTLASFANVSGSFYFRRTLKEGVARLAVGATGVTAFVGNSFATPEAKGFQISSGKLGLVVLEKTALEQARYALVASGNTGLTGLPDFTLNGNLSLQLQRFNATIEETVPAGSDSILVKFDSATDLTRLAGSVTLGTPIADLTGNFAVEATGSSPNRRILLAATDLTGFVGDKKNTATTADDAGVQFSSGSLLAVINASGTYGLSATGSASLVGVAGLSLSGTLTGQKNTTGSSVSEELTIGGVTETLTLAKDVSKVDGSVTLNAENTLYLTGTVGIEKKTATLTLLDGSTVQTTAVQIGGSGLSGFAGLNAAPGSSDQTGLSVSDVTFGYTLATPVDSKSGTDKRTWSGLKATLYNTSLVGVDVVTASVSNGTLLMNRAGGTLNGTPAAITANFEAAPLVNNAGAQSSTLDFKGNLLRATALIEFGISGFVNLRGRFGIEFGDMDVKLPSFPGISLPTNFIKFWGIDIDVSIGINGPSWSVPDFTGFDIHGLDFNLMLNMRNPFSGLLPDLGSMKWFSLNASFPEITFSPFPELNIPAFDPSFSLPNLSLNLTFDVPTLSIPTPYIDFNLTMPTITLPGFPAMPNFPGLPDLPAVPDMPNFDFDLPAFEMMQLGNLPAISLFDFITLSGSLTFKRVPYTATLNDGTTVDTWAIVMNSLDGGVFAGVNGPASNSDATGLSVAGVDGAMAILVPKDSADKRRWVAAAGTGNAVSLVGLPELTISATNFAVELNKSLGTATGGAANSSLVDFHANPLNVLMDDGSTVTITHPASSGALLKVATDATIGVADFFRVTGAFGVQTNTRDVSLSDGTSIAADVLM